MNLPHVVLKNIGDGHQVGDVVDASSFRNFKALLDQGFIRAATPSEVASWKKSHTVVAIPPESEEAQPPERLALEGLHPRVIEVAGKLYRDGHYRQAILDTYIALVEDVRKRAGLTGDTRRVITREIR